MRCPVMTCLFPTLLSYRHMPGQWFRASCRNFSSPILPIGAHQLGQISSGAAWQWCGLFNIASLHLGLASSIIWCEPFASSRGYPLPFCGIFGWGFLAAPDYLSYLSAFRYFQIMSDYPNPSWSSFPQLA